MKALILAAGRGTRIQSVHGEHPKCLIQFNDSSETILDHQIDSLLAAGVSKIGIVVGYEMEQIIQHVWTRYWNCRNRFHFIANPLFAETNNIYSLSLAKEWLKNDSFVCLNADVVFDSQILFPALRSTAPVTMIVDPEWRDETMKVVIENEHIVRMSKGIPRSEFSGTYLGITVFSEQVRAKFFQKVEALIEAGRVNDFFNVAVQQLADEGLHVGYSPTDGLPWAEIDDPGDLAFARLYVFSKLEAMAAAA